MQKNAPTLLVNDLIKGNKMLKELRDLTPTLQFRQLSSVIDTMDIWTFSDAYFNIASVRGYGQTGIVSGIKVNEVNGENAFHLVDWASTKKRIIKH